MNTDQQMMAVVPPRPDTYTVPTREKEDEFGTTIKKMSEDAFADAWQKATNAGQITVNADDPRILTAFKQANQYIADMAMAGLMTAEGAAGAAAGAIGEVFGGSPEGEIRLARDIMGMGEAFLGSGVMRGKDFLDEATEAVAGAGSKVAARLNQPGPMPETLGSNLGNVGQGGKPAALSVPRFPPARIAEESLQETPQETPLPKINFDEISREAQTRAEEAASRGAEASKRREEEVAFLAQTLRDDVYAREILDQMESMELFGVSPLDAARNFLSIVPEEVLPKDKVLLASVIDFMVQVRESSPEARKFSTLLPESDVFVDPGTRFRSPVLEVVSTITIPEKGITGSNFLKELERSPSVRNSEVAALDLGIKPGERYTREQLQEIVSNKAYQPYVERFSEVETGTFYSNIQRQRVTDDQEDYVELLVRVPGDKKKQFVTKEEKASRPHFGDSAEGVLAHTRASVRRSSFDNYLLVEELQSDLLQKGLISGKAPISKTKESVGLALDALLAEGQRRGVTRIVIPPFERIVAERFDPSSQPDEYAKALDPKSGFYATYVTGLKDALDDLQKEFPGAVKVDSIELPYTEFGLDPKILDIAEEVFGPIPEESIRDFAEEMNFALRGDEIGADIPDDVRLFFNRLEMEDLLGDNTFDPVPSDLPTEGIEIDFRELAEEFDLSRPRFAKGGMVEDTQMKRLMQEGGLTDDGTQIEPMTGNEVPPGSLAKEVRDDIPAQLSEGEYVVPADVVRFFGVKFFEDLRSRAKQGLSEMDKDGRIGGEPVNAQGLPVEGEDDELTPEEEQMLMEALGAGPAGMAEGGVVQQPFNRKDFQLNPNRSSGFQVVRYFNPQTKEERMIQFINGTPLGSIPAGFVPWSQELATQAQQTEQQQTPQVTVEGSRGGEGAGRAGEGEESQATGGGRGFSYDKWAEENYDAINADPFKFGMEALQDTTGKTLSRGLGAVGALTGAGVLGMVGAGVKTYNKAQNIAEANAALKVMEAQGLAGTQQYAALEKAIKSEASAIPLADWGVIATGANYFDSLNKVGATRTPTTATSTGTTGTRGSGTAGTTAPTSLSYGATTGRDSDGSDRDYSAPGRTSEAISSGGLGYSDSTTGGRTTGTGGIGEPSGTSLGYGSVSGSGPSATTGMSMGKETTSSVSKGTVSKENESYGTTGTSRGGRAKGGLVSKPAKAKAKAKGLAGK